MNLFSLLKKSMRIRERIYAHSRSTHITQTAVLAWGIIALIILFFWILGWDTYLFFQSTAMPKLDIVPSSHISITNKDIDDAIRILNEQQDKLNNSLREITTTTTISF